MTNNGLPTRATVQFYNTLTRHKSSFQPMDGHQVRMYTCGPTVYNFAHIGNFRAYIFEDILRRTLRYVGYDVLQVMNLTDIDDKTIRGSRQAQVPLQAFTKPFVDAFFADLQSLNIEPAEIYPAATAHVPEMIALIQRLFAKGMAYKSDDGSVYFKVSALPAYGKLAHLDLSGLRSGARVAQDEYEKESVGDFALWKAWDEKDGDVAWDSPWGRGRPGWHIECSAMGMKYLGETFDLHTGGIDNLFPHHENEIAQSEGATGKPFVNLWMHCAHLRVNGEKMSKSLGNFFTLRDLITKGYAGRELRYVLINGHYRQALNFTFDAVEAARTSLARIDEFVDRLSETAASAMPTVLPGWAAEIQRQFDAALFDDLNVPEALAALFALVREGNTALQNNKLAASEAAAVRQLVADFDRVLGIISFGRRDASALPAEITTLVNERQSARQNKNWTESDRLRDELARLGWEVRDGKDGQKVKKL